MSSRMRIVRCSGRLEGLGCLPRGVSAQGGLHHLYPLPEHELLTHACEKITFPDGKNN